MEKDQIDDRIYDLYDKYCHGGMDRRQFFERSAMITVGGLSGLAMAEAILPNYAEAQVVSFTDERIKARYVEYPSPGGTSGRMRGYRVSPEGEGPFPAVLVIHENRGLNPYIEDVARRVAVAGFLALAPDAGTRHGFHNNSTSRFDPEAAELAWNRTIAFFDKHLR